MFYCVSTWIYCSCWSHFLFDSLQVSFKLTWLIVERFKDLTQMSGVIFLQPLHLTFTSERHVRGKNLKSTSQLSESLQLNLNSAASNLKHLVFWCSAPPLVWFCSVLGVFGRRLANLRSVNCWLCRHGNCRSPPPQELSRPPPLLCWNRAEYKSGSPQSEPLLKNTEDGKTSSLKSSSSRRAERRTCSDVREQIRLVLKIWSDKQLLVSGQDFVFQSRVCLQGVFN